MDSMSLAKKIAECMENKKAEDVKILDIKELTTMADYFVICNGNSSTQMRAISDEIEEKLKDDGLFASGREGFGSDTWILMDYTDVIVHIFNKESRDFYGIENLWADAGVVDLTSLS